MPGAHEMGRRNTRTQWFIATLVALIVSMALYAPAFAHPPPGFLHLDAKRGQTDGQRADETAPQPTTAAGYCNE